jgi:mRNA interferase MazF
MPTWTKRKQPRIPLQTYGITIMMSAGTLVKQRDIVLIPFPFSDLNCYKRRPALVISTDQYNCRNQDVICCAITSNPFETYGLPILLDDLESGQLSFESSIKPTKVFTVKKSVVIKNLARLCIPKSREAIRQLVQEILIDPST